MAKKISDTATSCPHCGARYTDPSQKKALPAFLLAWFFGIFGAHRFYAGKTGTALLMLFLTLTLYGILITAIWSVVDMIIIACGAFTDKDGNKISW